MLLFDKIKLFLQRNLERIGVENDPNDDLKFGSNFENFTDYVDCIFEGKSERISLPE